MKEHVDLISSDLPLAKLFNRIPTRRMFYFFSCVVSDLQSDTA